MGVSQKYWIQRYPAVFMYSNKIDNRDNTQFKIKNSKLKINKLLNHVLNLIVAGFLIQQPFSRLDGPVGKSIA